MAYLGVDNCPNSLVNCTLPTALELAFQPPVFDTGLGFVAVFASTGKPILEKKTHFQLNSLWSVIWIR